MKPSILIVMLDFLVCSLLLFVIGTGGSQTQFATSAPPAVHEEFSPAAMQTQQEEWNRDYEQQALLTQLQSETAEKEQLRARLGETTANLKAVAEEKARVEESKTRIEQSLSHVETQLAQVNAERQKLQHEGEAAKERVAQLQTEQAKLEQERTQLQQQSQQLGQTVASQQATISTLGEQVRASQARVESQLADLTGTQQAAQQDLAALTENVKELQVGLSPEERARLLQAVADVAKGQQDLQSQLGGLIKSGQGEIGQSLNTIEAGQESLRQQTAKLGEQIESIKARGPGPYKAVKNARLELLVTIVRLDPRDNTTARFKSAVYPPVVNADGHAYIVAPAQTLGLTWWGVGGESELTELKYIANSAPLTGSACALQADARVVAVPMPGVNGMELAGPDAVSQKLHVFKSTAAGLSFEADTAPDLSDARYLVVKRPLRGIATWFENPAYRPDAGDYIVTADGKLVGLMVNREKCLLLTKDNLLNCSLTIPLSDKQQFQRAVRQFPRVK